MRKIRFDELQKIPGAGMEWVPPWHQEALMNCFQFMALELAPYEKFNSDGGACLLAKGSGKIGDRLISENTAFGVLYSEENGYTKVPEWFQATEPSIILCWNFNIFHNNCFGMGCGTMHVRVREMVIAGMQHS